jgi:hypothetical protein
MFNVQLFTGFSENLGIRENVDDARGGSLNKAIFPFARMQTQRASDCHTHSLLPSTFYAQETHQLASSHECHKHPTLYRAILQFRP